MNGLYSIIARAVLVSGLPFMTGCVPPVGKVVKKEVEPEREWIEHITRGGGRTSYIEHRYFLCKDDEDFVLLAENSNGHTRKVYVSKSIYDSYSIGDDIIYGRLKLRICGFADSRERIDESTAFNMAKNRHIIINNK